MRLQKSIMTLMLGGVIVLSACTEEYDDSALREDFNDLSARVEILEQLCNEMNTNISALQTAVTALQSNDYVTEIVPIYRRNEEIGYTITFAKAGSITIYHGSDGEDGSDGSDGNDGNDGFNGSDGNDGNDGSDGNDGQDGHPHTVLIR